MWIHKSMRPTLWLALCGALGALSACAANREAPKDAAAAPVPGRAAAAPSAPAEANAPATVPAAAASDRYQSPYRDPEAAQKLIDQYKEGIGRRPPTGRN